METNEQEKQEKIDSLNVQIIGGGVFIVVPLLMMLYSVLKYPNGYPIMWAWVLGFVMIIGGILLLLTAYMKKSELVV